MTRGAPDFSEPLDATFLGDLTDDLGLPKRDRRAFEEALLAASREFLEQRRRPKIGDVRDEIARLAKATAKALDNPAPERFERARQHLDRLTSEAIHFLLRHQAPHDRDVLPWDTSRLDQQDLEKIYFLCCVETQLRDNDGNRLPRPKIKYGPRRSKGRPIDYDQMILIARLGFAYETATGREPFRGKWDRNRGPFVRLVSGVFCQLGEERDDVDMIRKYLNERETL